MSLSAGFGLETGVYPFMLSLILDLHYEESPSVLKSWCEIETIVQVIWFWHLFSFWGITPLSPQFALCREKGSHPILKS